MREQKNSPSPAAAASSPTDRCPLGVPVTPSRLRANQKRSRVKRFLVEEGEEDKSEEEARGKNTRAALRELGETKSTN